MPRSVGCAADAGEVPAERFLQFAVVHVDGITAGHDDDVDVGQCFAVPAKGVANQAFEPIPVDGATRLLLRYG